MKLPWPAFQHNAKAPINDDPGDYMQLTRAQVFTPIDFPVHSYVARETEGLERKLKTAFEIPKAVISISGPSKAGKTVLIEKQVGPDNLITVSGAEIRTVDDLWDLVLDALDAPDQTTDTTATTKSGEIAVKAEGELGFKLIAKAKLGADLKGGLAKSDGVSNTRSRRGLSDVVSAIADTPIVVFIDDFHYIEKSIQVGVARQVKAAAGKGVRMVLAAVPHRADDAVRSNSELRGRTAQVDVGFWRSDELAQIAVLGFQALGHKISPDQAARFAREACGSPQLMQQICLQLCIEDGIFEARADGAALNLNDLIFAPDVIARALQGAAAQTDYTSLVDEMHQGPKVRGVERKEFAFKDGTKGDVYRAILLAIAAEPPASTIGYSDLLRRIEEVCKSETPGSGSVVTSLRHATNLVRERQPAERIIEWEDTPAGGVLNIIDPYLLFFLRSSDRLSQLGR